MKRSARLAIAPTTLVKPSKCNCTPATCGCKQKKLDVRRGSGKVEK